MCGSVFTFLHTHEIGNTVHFCALAKRSLILNALPEGLQLTVCMTGTAWDRVFSGDKC